MDTKYWNKKQTFFACKCEEQEDRNDGRQLRRFTHPQTNEPGQVYEYQQQGFSGIPESLWIEESEYGNTLNLGLQGENYVNVLKFKLFKAKGGLNGDILKIARVIGGIDFSKKLYVEIWENFKGAEKDSEGKLKVPVHLLFKRDVIGEKYPKSYPSLFNWNDEKKCYDGVPPVEVRKSMGKDVYDSTARDEFFYAIIEKAIADNKAVLDENKSARPQTEGEKSLSQPSLQTVHSAEVEEDEDQVPF